MKITRGKNQFAVALLTEITKHARRQRQQHQTVLIKIIFNHVIFFPCSFSTLTLTIFILSAITFCISFLSLIISNSSSAHTHSLSHMCVSFSNLIKIHLIIIFPSFFAGLDISLAHKSFCGLHKSSYSVFAFLAISSKQSRRFSRSTFNSFFLILVFFACAHDVCAILVCFMNCKFFPLTHHKRYCMHCLL